MTQELYDANYFRSYIKGASDPLHALRMQMYRQELDRIVAFVSSGAVLDYGCGTGEFLALFDPARWTRYGIEISDFARALAVTQGVSFEFDRDKAGQFDLVVFRGTIQHIEDPIAAIKDAIRWLKPGGIIVFLATPNTGGICYRLFQDLPMIAPKYNFVLFSDRILTQVLENLGLKVLRFEYPYWGTPYENWPKDLLKFILRLFGIKGKFAFWGNVFECYARKP